MKKKQTLQVAQCLDYLQKLLNDMNRTVRVLENDYSEKRLYCSNGTWERLGELRSYRDGIKARLNDMDYLAETLESSELSDTFARMLSAPLNIRLKSDERLISEFPFPQLTIEEADDRFNTLAGEITEMLAFTIRGKQVLRT